MEQHYVVGNNYGSLDGTLKVGFFNDGTMDTKFIFNTNPNK